VISIAVENVRKCYHSSLRSHPEKEILILTTRELLPIASDVVEGLATEHDRTVRKWDISGTADEAPTISRPNFSTGGINAITQCPYCHHV